MTNDGIPQGLDGLQLGQVNGTSWARGSVQEVGFAILANHGGGYSWRLCPADGNVTEECFQQHVLKFSGDTHQIQHDSVTYQYNKQVKLPPFSIPRHTTTEGTFPKGSEWARVPIPGCKLCDQSSCGPGLYPNLTDRFESELLRDLGYRNSSALGGLEWFEQQVCAQSCSGINLTACPPGMLQFPEPANGLSGYYRSDDGMVYSILDRVHVPEAMAPGSYLLSWRWDCEQSHQIWQNCADIQITDPQEEVVPLV